MISKPSQLDGASPELKKEIEAFAVNAAKAGWDLYPTRFEEKGVFVGLYQQLGTNQGSLTLLLTMMPATLEHLGNGIFALKKGK